MAFLEMDFSVQSIESHQNVWVVLPDGAEPPYKTLWLLHGGAEDCSEWVRETALERHARKYGLAVVMPTISNGFSMNMAWGGRYLDMLTQELTEAVRNLLPALSRRREDNFVAGASMGGYGAVKWAFHRPDLFCKAGSFAGALDMSDIFEKFTQGKQPGGRDFWNAFGSIQRVHTPENDLFLLARKQISAGVELPKLWGMISTEDFGYQQNLKARDALLAEGVDLCWNEGPGDHSYETWEPWIEPFFRWLTEEKGAE